MVLLVLAFVSVATLALCVFVTLEEKGIRRHSCFGPKLARGQHADYLTGK